MAFNPDMGINQAPRRRPLFGPRELASLAGGFSAPSSGGFWGGLSAGLSGSLGGASRFDVQTHEDEKEQLRQMMRERLDKRDQERLDIEKQRLKLAQDKETWDQEHPSGGRDETPMPGVVPYGSMGPLAPGEAYAPENLPPSSYKSFFNSKAAALGGEAGRAGRPEKEDPFMAWIKKREYDAEHKAPPEPSDKLQERVRLINSMDPMDKEDFETLMGIVSNPPSKEEQEAARGKLKKRIGIQSRPQPFKR